ncbi:MAG TPA: OpgC domain-containing protein [Xanthobacteraceae bacterium]|nr:OpgC domain-containing protein [Xanthobacteraceae bacterium]
MVETSRKLSTAPQATGPTERDLRLDLFRGLALWLIFLDHIPSNVVNWITIRNYGFSDAAEIFVFISGYTAAFVYGRAMRERGVVVASARILRRAWQVYVAHIFLFVVYLAEISYVAGSFDNPLYAEETNIFDFLRQPDITLVQALLLKFKPVNMDVLPLYVVLLLGFPLLLWLLLRQPTLGLVASAALYVLSSRFDWNLPAYPSGVWAFNPYAWQLLFVVGAWCGVTGAVRLDKFIRSRVVAGLAVAYLIFAFLIVMTWYLPAYGRFVPRWLAEFMYPIDKTNLDVLRLVHFLALAVLTIRFIPRDWAALKSPLLRPAILCGQHSLEVFCLGVFLAFAGHFVRVELSGGALLQILISLLGIAVMVVAAWLLSWYQVAEGRGPATRPKTANSDMAGGSI